MFFNRSQQSQQIQSTRVRDRISSMFIVVSAAAAGSSGRRRLLRLVPPAESCEERNWGREELSFPEACVTRPDVSRPGPGVGVSGVWCQVLWVTAVRRWWSAADLGASHSLGPASHPALAGCKLQLLLPSLKRNRSFRTLFYFCDKLEETPIIVNLGK